MCVVVCTYMHVIHTRTRVTRHTQTYIHAHTRTHAHIRTQRNMLDQCIKIPHTAHKTGRYAGSQSMYQ